MKQRGLVIIYDPHALMQFFEFYCMGDYEAEWDALCLPKEDGEEEMHLYCERAGVFNKIYIGKSEYKNLSLKNKLKLFIPMVLYSAIGQRRRYCKKTLNQYVGNINDYDILAANTDTGFVSGMLASFGKEKEVIYFEDGVGDYSVNRKRWQSHFRAGTFENFQCVLMARLGYFGKGFTYLKPTRETIKYCSVKEELTYRNYKEIRQFSMDSNALEKFRALQDQVYPELKKLKIDENTAVAFTDPVEIECDDWKKYVEQFVGVLCQKHNRILLKCHPRGSEDIYSFPDNVTVELVPKDIPAELLLPYLNGNDCYFMFPNSILLNMKPYNLNIRIVFSEDIYNQMDQKVKVYDDAVCNGIDLLRERCDRFVKGQYHIIEI